MNNNIDKNNKNNIDINEIYKTAMTGLGWLDRGNEVVKWLNGPSFIEAIKQIKVTLNSDLLSRLETSNFIKISEEVDKKLAVANQYVLELTEKNSITNILESSKALHQSWLDKIKPLQQYLSQTQALQLQAFADQTLSDISRQLALTEQLMTGISFEAISSRFQVKMSVVSGLESSIAQVSTLYAELTGSLQNISDITHLPSFVLPSATREIFTTSIALKAFYSEKERHNAETEIQHQIVFQTGALLERFNPSLVKPYIGAWEALRGNNPDRARHILVSIRELLRWSLRQFAPDDSVSAWIPGEANQKGLLHKGSPTQRSKLLYHYRYLNSGPQSAFVESDIVTWIKLCKKSNRIHQLAISMDDKELEKFFLDVSRLLVSILQISVNN